MKLIRRSLAEEVVDVVVGDLGEWARGPRRRLLLGEDVEHLRELLSGLLHPQAHQPQRALRIEDDDQDHPAAHDAHVERLPLALVELVRDLLLADELREAPHRRDVARGQRGERGRVEVLGLAARRDELTVLVDEEDDLGVRVAREPVADPGDEPELLLVHHQAGIHARRLSAKIQIIAEYQGTAPLSILEPPPITALSAWTSASCSPPLRSGGRAPRPSAGRSWAPAGHSSRRPARARASVTWSAYSRSPPMGTPCAMRVTLIPIGFRSFER